MSAAHSKYSASGFEAATLCPGKRVMERGKPDSSSKYADEGTAAHALLADHVDGKALPSAYAVNGKDWPVTTEMAEAVQTALDNIRAIVGDGMLLSEQRVNYSRFLGVPEDDAWGTSDIIGARATELQVHDYKHGMGVEVDAEDNPQMKLYALGALDAVDEVLGPFETVRLVIHQPRIKSAPSEWVISVEDLKAWGAGEARRSVGEQQGSEKMFDTSESMTHTEWERIYLRPNEKSCKFCRAKATCPALRSEVANAVSPAPAPASPDEFAELPILDKGDIAAPMDDQGAWLSASLQRVDLIEDWCKAVRAEVERRLLAGGEVTGFKVVQGKRGNRAWKNVEEAEAALKGMRLKVEEMYDLKLISPTSAEKLAKPAKKEGDPAPLIGPRQWTKVQALITQADGRPHVAPVSDPRPALVLTKAEDDFDTVSTEPLYDFA